jgi:hypothetical protein
MLPGLIKSALALYLLFYMNNISASELQSDSIALDTKKIYALALDGNINNVLQLISDPDNSTLSEAEYKLKTGFENRFKFPEDQSNYLEEKKSGVDELLLIYRNYWRSALLARSLDNDSVLKSELIVFFNRKFNASDSQEVSIDESLDQFVKKYVSDAGLFTTGFGKTGKFYDLLIWKTQEDTSYEFPIHEEIVASRVVFMDDFVTLGWQEYATLGRHYPGGWANTDALFCVKKAYDLNSENFLVSYLAHEGRHFSDYKLFPDLSGADLEYRAKLTELSLAKETLYNVIEFFIKNGNRESDNAHALANYFVIKDLSRQIFQSDYESDIEKWKQVGVEMINNESYSLLNFNTGELNKLGKETKGLIKKPE